MATKSANAADCVPEPCRIAGTRMRPFCLGHHLLLKRLGLPFAGSPAADCGPGDILLGVLVCAQSYEDTLEQMHAGEWEDVQRRWLKDIAKRKTDMADVEARFRFYLVDGYAQPPVYRSAQGKIKLTAPWECLLKVGLTRAGFSESEALNGYLPGRWYDYFTAMEQAGAERCDDEKAWKPLFMTSREAEAIAAAKEAQKDAES